MSDARLLAPIDPEHPIWPAPFEKFDGFVKNYGVDGWNKMIAARNRRILAAENDPLRHGYKPDTWDEIWSLLSKYSTVAVLGGNRSGKSEFAGDTVARVLTEGRFFDGGKISRKDICVACMFASQRSSWMLQQPYVYRHLPPDVRDCGKSTGGDVVYRKGKGFVNDMFITPNGSQCQFWFYEQEPDLIEGQEYDLVWLDEYLKGNWLELMNYRVAGVNGRILITVTLVHGMTRPIKEIMDTCEIVKTAPVNPDFFSENVGDMVLAKDCPKGEVPVLMVDERKSAAVYFLHTQRNRFVDIDAFRKKLIDAPREKVLIRAYGYCDFTAVSAFPKFSKKVHVVSLAWIRKTAELQRYTLYCSADPGGGKPWVIKWYAVFENNWIVCLYEYPQYKLYGEWARPPEKDEKCPCWLAGPAQSANPGAGFLRVKGVLKDVERKILPKILGARSDEIFIYARYIDPRMGAQIAPSMDDNGTSYIDLMRSIQEKDGEVVGESYLFTPAKTGAPNGGKLAIESSIALINDRLDYDSDKPVSVENCPTFYFSEECEQSIISYKNFSVNSSRNCALKDFIDPDRYLLNMQPQFVDWEEEEGAVRIGGY